MAAVLSIEYDASDRLVMTMLDSLISAVRQAFDYPTTAMEDYKNRVQNASLRDLAEGLLTKEDDKLFREQLFDPRSEYLPHRVIHEILLMGYELRFTKHFIDLFTRLSHYPQLLDLEDRWYHFPLHKAQVDMVDGKPHLVTLFTGERYPMPPNVKQPIALGNTFIDYNPDEKKAVMNYELIDHSN